MALPKGRTNNPNGRPIGATNKVGSDLKQRIADLLNDKFDAFNTALDGLDDRDLVRAYTDLVPFAVPKMATAQVNIETIEAIKKTVSDLFPDEVKDGESES
jgi:hypothetical protein